MRRSLLLLFALLLPGGVALGQEAGQPEAPPPAPPPEAPPIPKAPPPSPPEESTPGMETLIPGKISQGGYGGPVFVYSRVLDRDALLFGGRGGWIANHHFVFGAGGFALVNTIPAPVGAPVIGEDLRLNFGYGGLWLEYIFLPNKLVHASVGTLLGGGLVGYWRQHHRERDDHEVESDVVFAVDPVLSAEVNIVSYMRLSLGVGYRYVGSVDLSGLRDGDVSGFSGSVMLKFGQF